MPISLEALMSFAAVLGIARCLPYELPSLLAIPYDIDPHAHMKGVHQSISTKDGLDTYGRALQCNTIKVPLMLYSNDVRRPNVLARATNNMHPTSSRVSVKNKHSLFHSQYRLLKYVQECGEM